jgi:acyl carrier protein
MVLPPAPDMEVPSFEAFSSLVARELAADRVPERGGSLGEDSGFDSLSLFELYALIFDTYGIDLANVLTSTRTFGDVYDAVVQASVDSGLAASPRATPR